MKATEAKLLEFLDRTPQAIIPIYQRTYSWTREQCRQLWDDVVRAAMDESVTDHFIGSVVYIHEGVHHQSSVPELLVIDGQQRLTTLSLLLSVVGRAIERGGDGGDITQRRINNYYLFNAEEDGDLRYKLLLTQTDRDTLIRIVEDKPMPESVSQRMVQNYQFFEDQIKTTGIAPGSCTVESPSC